MLLFRIRRGVISIIIESRNRLREKEASTVIEAEWDFIETPLMREILVFVVGVKQVFITGLSGIDAQHFQKALVIKTVAGAYLCIGR